jgi:hypothetical protein
MENFRAPTSITQITDQMDMEDIEIAQFRAIYMNTYAYTFPFEI